MKKTIAFLLCAVMLLTLCACGNSSTPASGAPSAGSADQTQAADTPKGDPIEIKLTIPRGARRLLPLRNVPRKFTSGPTEW